MKRIFTGLVRIFEKSRNIKKKKFKIKSKYFKDTESIEIETDNIKRVNTTYSNQNVIESIDINTSLNLLNSFNTR